MRIESPERWVGSTGKYIELRRQENRQAAITLVNGDVMGNGASRTGGVSARVYRGGSWGFYSSPGTDDEACSRAVIVADRNASFLHGCGPLGHPSLDERPARDSLDMTTRKSRSSSAQKMQFLRNLDDYILRTHPDINSRTINLGSLDTEKHLVSSFGTDAYSCVTRAHISVRLSLTADGDAVAYGKNFGGPGNFEDNFVEPADLYGEIDAVVDRLRDKAAGGVARTGVRDVILNSNLAGILAHEAVGHTVEADLVKAGSVAGRLVGEPVASDIVTLVDYAHRTPDGPCPVPLRVDDEGTPAEDAVLIENGILKRFLHSKETARDFEAKPLGNGRASEFQDEPLVRMRNTAILSGNDSLDDMIASVEDGYYLMDPVNGQADLTGEFMFGVAMGYEIRNGRLGRAIRDTTISGMAFEVLRTVTMLSGEMTWLNGGMCGKKQMIPVGMGGPAVKCRLMVGGR